jgi:hypothetical protein
MSRTAILVISLFLYWFLVQAQDVKTIQLELADAATLQQLLGQQHDIDFRLNQLKQRLYLQYGTVITYAVSGTTKLPVYNPKPGWEYGALFSEDSKTMIARPKPVEEPKKDCPSDDSGNSGLK